MSFYYRSYFDKDTTIYNDSLLNVGNNHIGEIVSLDTDCCGAFSRYLFHFDIEYLRKLYNNCYDISKLSHKIKLYPNLNICDEEKVALGSNIFLFKIEQEWDEGCGHTTNYSNPCNCTSIYKNSNEISTNAANWYYAKDGVEWETEGIYDIVNYIEDSGTTCFYLPNSNQVDPPTAITISNVSCEIQYSGECNEAVYVTAITENTIYCDPDCELEPSEIDCYLYSYSAITNFIQCYQIPCDTYCGIEFDVTNLINKMVEEDLPNHGFGLAFCPDDELSFDNKAVRFHSSNSLSFFKPFLESKNCECIIDNRSEIKQNTISSVYLYTNTPLDNCPTVHIVDDKNCVLSSTGSTCVDNCIYKADFIISGNTECTSYNDIWSNININGVKKDDIINEFYLAEDDFINNNFKNSINSTSVSVSGVKKNESLKKGDKRKINIHLNNLYKDPCDLNIQSIEYKISKYEGYQKYTVLDWCGVNQIDCQNYIILDTSWMLPTCYTLDIRVNSKLESIQQCNELSFCIEYSDYC